jgi:hypothetical protein
MYENLVKRVSLKNNSFISKYREADDDDKYDYTENLSFDDEMSPNLNVLSFNYEVKEIADVNFDQQMNEQVNSFLNELEEEDKKVRINLASSKKYLI